jgi:hypothetical protein
MVQFPDKTHFRVQNPVSSREDLVHRDFPYRLPAARLEFSQSNHTRPKIAVTNKTGGVLTGTLLP